MSTIKVIYAPALLAATISIGCAAPALERYSMGWVDSAAEVEAFSSFLVIEETTREGVLTRLGLPTNSVDFDDGHLLDSYEWETSAWRKPETKHEEGSDHYDPFGHGTEAERTFEIAWLMIQYGPELVVKGYSVKGPGGT